MPHPRGAQTHFARVAPVYDRFRDTDPDVVETITAQLPPRSGRIAVVDIGCGTGRYSQILAERIGASLQLICCDYSEAMLAECRDRLHSDATHADVGFCRASALHLPFGSGCVDAVVTFNAVHHFELERFMTECARILRGGGLLAIYTRTPKQNARTVWGQFFPGFTEYETRLYGADRLQAAVAAVPTLAFEGIREFAHVRSEPADSLVARARNFHYSTFALYPPAEFEAALSTFAARLAGSAIGKGRIEHTAENTLVLAHRLSDAPSIDITP
ncbi:MAG: class I SAM-dependent methyltransferase [candidate division Zixibacteria bacterium]|nr:class I SAM-dependent methyltransferase [candidate division Zixibacteria bacterium]